MSGETSNVKSIFGRAVEISSPDERSAYLDKACGGDAALRQQVVQLLAAADDGGAFMRQPAMDLGQTAAFTPLKEGPGTVIGPYKLLQQIGEGGMGIVFMAEQSRPVHRVVALKIIKPGMDSRQVIARFEAERQALAMMDHPNIAHVLDAGTTDSALPYFVMELVKGLPITEYCDQHHLTPRERLELFVPVCQAVQHAHQKGVIHRDLKPSNVLVALYDGRPVPKIIDFGVAKATGQKLTDRTMFTEFGAIMGTLEYMSPEQADMNQLDIDTRSDVYSLGVLMYELLTGTTPFEKKRLRTAALDQLLRIIREEEPPKPSARLSTIVELASVAANRSLEPKRLSSMLRGDLDWVVMKALEKDRNRRYETATGLASDVQRFLRDEPVLACPPSALYRLRKLARRNKLAVAACVLVAFTIAALLAGSLVFAVQQKRVAEEKQALADDRSQLAEDKEQSRRDAETKLYRALLSTAYGGRLARIPGYRATAWTILHEAAALDIPDKNLDEIRDQVLPALGDPIGLAPVEEPQVPRATRLTFPADMQRLTSNSSASRTAVSNDGQWLAVSRTGRTNSVLLFDHQGNEIASQEVPLSLVHVLQFSADNHYLVAGCEQGVMVWTVPDLRQRTMFQGGVVRILATQPRGDLAATMNISRRIELFSLTSNRLVVSLMAPRLVTSIEFSEDGKMLLGISADRQNLWGWYVEDTPEKQYLVGHEEGVPSAAFSPDGRSLASVSKDRTVRIWDVQTGALQHVCLGHTAEIEAVEFSPDGNLLVTGDWSGSIRLWNPSTGKELGVAKHGGRVWRMRFDASGRMLISGGRPNVVCWRVNRNEDQVELDQIAAVPIADVYDVNVHPAGTSFVALDRSTSPPHVIYYDLAKNAPPQTLDLPALYQIDVLHFDRLGQRLRFTTRQTAIGTWDFASSQVTHVTARGFPPAGGRLSITADDRWAAIQGPFGQAVSIYDLTNDRPLFTLPREQNDIWSLRWSPDGRRLVVSCSDGVLAIWNIDEVRARLAEFAIDLSSTAVDLKDQPPVPQLSAAQLEQIVETQKASLGRAQQK